MVYWLVGIVLFYILSTGPIIRLADHEYIPLSFTVVYQPLAWAVDLPVVGPHISLFLNEYVRLWDPDA